MKRINEIDPFVLGRSPLSEQEREKLRLAKRQQQKEDGYQYLTELCSIGEYDAAKQLANQNSNWGYEVIDGVVVERFD
jgi:ankyrin repeat protein